MKPIGALTWNPPPLLNPDHCICEEDKWRKDCPMHGVASDIPAAPVTWELGETFEEAMDRLRKETEEFGFGWIQQSPKEQS
jgi:hypothetical protein